MAMALPNVNISTLLIATFIFAPIEAGRIKLRRTMTSAGIVPDVIDAIPQRVLHVAYSPAVQVRLGNELTPAQVRQQPTSVDWHAHRRELYTLVMVNPDAPDPETLHWLVVNIDGSQLATTGDTYAAYIGAGPPKNADLNRYVLLVYRQSGNLTLERAKVSDTSAEGRFGFKVRDFAAENNLIGPVAGNFFMAQYDESVPLLYEQVGGGLDEVKSENEP